MGRIVFVVNGVVGMEKQVSDLLLPDDFLVAIDGGGRTFIGLPTPPNILIGDLDSIDPEDVQALEGRGTIVHRHPTMKYASDLELGLNYCLNRPEGEVVVVTRAGGRADHSYSNFMLLCDQRFASKSIKVVDGEQVWLVLHGPQKRVLDMQVGSSFSVVAATPKVTKLGIEGAEWDLHDTELSAGSTLGISNIARQKQVTVSLESGTLALFLQG